MCHLSDRNCLRQIPLVACSHNTMRKQLYSFVIVVTMLKAQYEQHALCVVQCWPPCDEGMLKSFRWDTVQPSPSQLLEAEASPSMQQQEQRSSSEAISERLRSPQTGHTLAAASVGSPPSTGKMPLVGLHSAGGHLY